MSVFWTLPDTVATINSDDAHPSLPNHRTVRRVPQNDVTQERVYNPWHEIWTKGHPRPRFSHDTVQRIGIVQLICGFASVFLAIVASKSGTDSAMGYCYGNGSGFWSGVCFATAGICGVSSSRRKTNGAIISSMVFSAIAAIIALMLILHPLIYIKKYEYSNMIPLISLATISILAFGCGVTSCILSLKSVYRIWYNLDTEYANAVELSVSNVLAAQRNIPQPYLHYSYTQPAVSHGTISSSSVHSYQIQHSTYSNFVLPQYPIGMTMATPCTNFVPGDYRGMTTRYPYYQSEDCMEYDPIPPGTPPPSYSMLEINHVGKNVDEVDVISHSSSLHGSDDSFVSVRECISNYQCADFDSSECISEQCETLIMDPSNNASNVEEVEYRTL